MSRRAWIDVLSEVEGVLAEFRKDGHVDPYFRGHSDAKWTLLPSLSRVPGLSDEVENRLYCQFMSLGGHLLPADTSAWDPLFLMQHHGVPTRLLDWTESFAVALYFAVHRATGNAAVWILDPYVLNAGSYNREVVELLDTAFPAGFERYFVEERNDTYGKFPASVLAISGSPRTSRMRSQRSVFTLHSDLTRPLEKLFPGAARKIVIPRSVMHDAKRFLQLAGVNESTCFPDLDGLGRYLTETECSRDRHR